MTLFHIEMRQSGLTVILPANDQMHLTVGLKGWQLTSMFMLSRCRMTEKLSSLFRHEKLQSRSHHEFLED
jgi:hypothetical protein